MHLPVCVDQAEGWGVGPLMAQVAHATSAVSFFPLQTCLTIDAQLGHLCIRYRSCTKLVTVRRRRHTWTISRTCARSVSYSSLSLLRPPHCVLMLTAPTSLHAHAHARIGRHAGTLIRSSPSHPLLTSYLAHDADARLMVICHDQTADQTSIQKLAGLLSAADPAVPYHLWIEHPENVPTCLALAPNRRESKIKKALDKSGARLWKG